MEVYVEFKPCYKTLYKYNVALCIDGEPILPDFCDFKTHFIDGKCDDIHLNVTDDYKFVYGFYNGKPTFFRITNISSKPIQNKKYNKVEEWG